MHCSQLENQKLLLGKDDKVRCIQQCVHNGVLVLKRLNVFESMYMYHGSHTHHYCIWGIWLHYSLDLCPFLGWPHRLHSCCLLGAVLAEAGGWMCDGWTWLGWLGELDTWFNGGDGGVGSAIMSLFTCFTFSSASPLGNAVPKSPSSSLSSAGRF